MSFIIVGTNEAAPMRACPSLLLSEDAALPTCFEEMQQLGRNDTWPHIEEIVALERKRLWGLSSAVVLHHQQISETPLYATRFYPASRFSSDYEATEQYSYNCAVCYLLEKGRMQPGYPEMRARLGRRAQPILPTAFSLYHTTLPSLSLYMHDSYVHMRMYAYM
ncbi:hypothetical protein DINM_005177 [Dirofilaria immitis]|nr:hypothetical protein [Dirofilaria immitis]